MTYRHTIWHSENSPSATLFTHQSRRAFSLRPLNATLHISGVSFLHPVPFIHERFSLRKSSRVVWTYNALWVLTLCSRDNTGSAFNNMISFFSELCLYLFYSYAVFQLV